MALRIATKLPVRPRRPKRIGNVRAHVNFPQKFAEAENATHPNGGILRSDFLEVLAFRAIFTSFHAKCVFTCKAMKNSD